MKKLIILILPILILLSSCELMLPNNKTDRNVYLVSLALEYYSSNKLYGTLNDQKGIHEEVEFLCNNNSYPLNYTLITQEANKIKVNNNNVEKKEYDYIIGTHSTIIKDTLLNTLKTYASKMDDNDLLLFHYSGHGYDDGNLVYDIIYKSYMKLDLYFITIDEIYNAIKDSKGIKFLIIDSCFSGNLYDQLTSEKDNNSFNNIFENPSVNNNIFILSGARSDEKSYEWPNKDDYSDGITYPILGDMTRLFLRRLGYDDIKMKPGSTGKKVYFSEVVTYIQKNIASLPCYVPPELLNKTIYSGMNQHPQNVEIKDFILF